jgi:hypothetical protein
MTATKQTELLPCPFCKRKAQQTLSSGLVSCAHESCPAFLLAVTAEHWNTRAQSAEPVQGEAFKINAQPAVAENTGSTTTKSTPTGSGAGSLPVEAAATACEAGKGVDIFAWATFDGEGGYDLRLFENNEGYMADWLETNGARYARWVFPLYTSPAKPDAELLECERLRVALSESKRLLEQSLILKGPGGMSFKYRPPIALKKAIDVIDAALSAKPQA